MIIGLSSGNFHRVFPETSENSLLSGFSFWKKEYGNALEIHCSSENIIDYFLNNKFDLSLFSYLSVHAPTISNQKKEKIKRILQKLKVIHRKYEISNFVFHVDEKTDWKLLSSFNDIPVSVENMDSDKNDGRFLEEVGEILLKHNLNLTLDLQHCYTNDKSMKLARDFQKEFKERIVEYHLSGFHKKFKHYPLFKTEQDEIAQALEMKNIPIIIESTFDVESDAKREVNYIEMLVKEHI